MSLNDIAFFINMVPKPIGGATGENLCSVIYYDPDTSILEEDARYGVCGPETGKGIFFPPSFLFLLIFLFTADSCVNDCGFNTFFFSFFFSLFFLDNC